MRFMDTPNILGQTYPPDGIRTPLVNDGAHRLGSNSRRGLSNGCVSVGDGRLVVMQGLEQLAMMSARSFFRIFLHILATDLTSRFLPDLRRRYIKVFSFEKNFGGLQFYHLITMIHALVYLRWDRCNLQWDEHRPSIREHILFPRHLVTVARVEHLRRWG